MEDSVRKLGTLPRHGRGRVGPREDTDAEDIGEAKDIGLGEHGLPDGRTPAETPAEASEHHIERLEMPPTLCVRDDTYILG